MGNISSNTKSTPIHVLIAHKSDADASAITEEINRATGLHTVITRTTNTKHCLQLMDTLIPNVVIADYDFGLFPFINELRDKNSDIPFIIISELELMQNAPKEGLNIYILKSNLGRLPSWLETLHAAGMLNESVEHRPAQIKHFQKAVERRQPSSAPVLNGERHRIVYTAPLQERRTSISPVEKIDPLKKWTEDLQKKMQANEESVGTSHHRTNPLFPERDNRG